VRLPVDAIYYISLPKAGVRRAKLVKHLDSIGLVDKHGCAAQWIIANDGNHVEHRIDNSIKRAHKRPNMSLSEIGCFASHREVWQEQIKHEHQFVLVLEDDARFDVKKLNQLLTNWNMLPEFDFLHLGWEYYAGYKEQTIEQVEIEGLPNLWKGDGMWLTHAYILSPDGAAMLLDRTEVQTNGLDAMTADIQSEMWAYGFKPAIAYQDKGSSGVMRSQIHHTG
jgi:GR25 family glycosyltransferase involved in LPS biosynthesis